MKSVRKPDDPVRLFKDQSAWVAWLREHHRNASGIWLRLAKKGSGLQSVSYSEALESGLCYGWIDGQKGAIARAEANGRWAAAYDSPSGSTVPGDFQAALDANARANSFFQTLDRANRYAILFRIQTVKKAETRERKIKEFIAMLERKEKIHP